METVVHSIIVPVYRNEASLPALLEVLESLGRKLESLEVVFVIDGSPDNSWAFLKNRLISASFASQLLAHSRNFGSFAAIRTGLEHARGGYCSVMSADMQEPPEFIEQIFQTLRSQPVDVVIGVRENRVDPFFQALASSLFWVLYRCWIQPEMPKGGIDVFGCNRHFCETLTGLRESNTTLVGLVVWMGFRRVTLTYNRLARQHGKSAWTLDRKIRYMLDSLFAFSDLPIIIMILTGLLGVCLSVSLAAVILIAKHRHLIQVPGYAATILTVMFFGALNSFGLGIIGSYMWRTFENTKGRPSSIVMSKFLFPPDPHG